MSQLSLDIPHTLSQEEAVARLRNKFDAVRAEYQDRVDDLNEEWNDHTLSFGVKVLGMSVSGTVAVEPDRVCLDAQLPMAVALFKGVIEERIRQEVDALQAPAS